MEITSKPFLLFSEVCDYLRLSRETLRLILKRGEIPSIRLGKRKWGILKTDVDSWLASQDNSSHKGGKK